MKKALTIAAAAFVLAAPAHAAHLSCDVVRHSDSQPLEFRYSTNEAHGTLTETLVSTGNQSTYRANYSANTITAPFKVAGFSSQVQINRITGELNRAVASSTFSGTCKAIEVKNQLF